MGKSPNISPDSRMINLLEVQIANQKKIMAEFARLNERFDRLEAYVGMTEREKHKPIFFTTEQVMDMLGLSRNTLFNYRKKGILTFMKVGNTIRYTMDDINKLKAYLNKTA